jgi:uncharacterized Zn finger protein
MINFYTTWLEINCPKCSYQIDIQLIDVRDEITVFCHNCKTNIQLFNEDASVDTGIAKINQTMKDLDDTLNKLFR